ANSRKFLSAIDNHALQLRIQLRPRHIQRNAGLASELLHLCRISAIFRLGPGLNGAFIERLRLIRNHQVKIEVDCVPETLAARARAEWVVEREQPRLRLFVTNAAVLAFKALREAELPCGLIVAR